jgi:hypothetical protein
MSNYTKKQLEDIIAGLNSKLDCMKNQLDGLQPLITKVTNLEQLLKSANESNAELVKALEFKDKQLDGLTVKLNSLEQYNRSWSIRVHGLPLTTSRETDSTYVKEQLYDRVLLPILQGAVEEGDLSDIPPVERLIEHAHILPTREKDKVKPIIARFYSRDMRGLIFKHKRAYAPRDQPSPSRAASGREERGRVRFSIFEDLTKMNFTKMRAIASHESVEACWSTGGQLRFKMMDSDAIKKVKNILDPVEKIILS